ncbi:MAG: hypothetical protein WBC62_09095 [Candidatus Macondimonas sp.]
MPEQKRAWRWWSAKNRVLIEHRRRFLVLGLGLCLIAIYYSAILPPGGRMIAYLLTRQADPQLQLAFILGGTFLFLGLWGYKLHHDSN